MTNGSDRYRPGDEVSGYGRSTRMPKGNRKFKTSIYSIFGQIEGVIADAMAEEGLVTKIPKDRIPPTARWNDEGIEAHCALVFTEETRRLFDERVANLRA
jgi:hypothetical protein